MQLTRYKLNDFTNNIVGNLYGGITAGIIALPLALAFGIASGIGPIAGLYGAAIVGLFAAIFGGTPTQISGPTGPMTVIMTGIVTQLLAAEPDIGLSLAFTSVFLGGLFQIALGYFKFGRYIIMVPYPVISGFMSGIGIIIICLQLSPILGFTSSGGVLNAVKDLPEHLVHANSASLIIGLTALGIVLLWRGKLNKIIPGALVALIVCSLLGRYILSSGFDTIGEIPSALPQLYLPTFTFNTLQIVVGNALVLAVLGAIDSLLTSLIADNITDQEHDSNRELIGQGIGNTIAGLFGGIPGAGATMRTMVNVRSGGTGPLSGVIHALLLLIITLGAGSIFRDVPLAALAGILIKVGLDIIDWPFFKKITKMPVFPVLLMTTVCFLTVFVDLITAVFVGVFIKNIVVLEKISELQLGSVSLTDPKEQYQSHNQTTQKLVDTYDGQVVLLSINGPLSYGAGRILKRLLNEHQHKDALLIDLSNATLIGLSTAMMLEDIIHRARNHNMAVEFIGMSEQVRNDLVSLGVI